MRFHRIPLALLSIAAVSASAQTKPGFNVVEATIPQMQEALAHKQVTSRQLVTQYLLRIALYDRTLHSLITVNPHILEEADERDRERARGQIRGPLHGIPIA